MDNIFVYLIYIGVYLIMFVTQSDIFNFFIIKFFFKFICLNKYKLRNSFKFFDMKIKICLEKLKVIRNKVFFICYTTVNGVTYVSFMLSKYNSYLIHKNNFENIIFILHTFILNKNYLKLLKYLKFLIR